MPPALLPSNEADRLAALHSYKILDTENEAAFDTLVGLAAQLTNCPTALVTLMDQDRQWFKARHCWGARETHRNLAFCAHAILDPAHVMVVPDATADSRFADNPLVTGEPGIRFFAGAPLVNAEGFAIGTVCVIDYAPRQIGHGDVEAVSMLAQAVMSALELRRANLSMQAMTKAAIERFSNVVESLPTALLVSGRAGQIQLINHRAEQMFGYERAELLGLPLEILIPERFRKAHVGLREGFLADMSARMMGEGRALFGRRRDGSEFPLEIGLSPIDLDGEPMALTVIVDVGPLRKIELEREVQRRELERSNSDLQEFAYAASHDLKAPLRAIAHLADWIREDVEPIAQADTLDNIKLLQGRVARLQMLLDGLLAYSRLGHSDAPAEDVDIAAVVRDVVTMILLPPGFVVECEGQMTVIRAHRAPLEMVFKNLISNAVQHHDRADGRIVVSMRMVDGKAEFRVTDDGPGIAKSFHDRIFIIFQTLSSRDDKEASGIGLSIVKKKVESNGGSIHVESNPPDRGASFVFTWRVSSP